MKGVTVDSMPIVRFMAITDALRAVAATKTPSPVTEEVINQTPNAVLRSILVQDETLDLSTIPPQLRTFYDWVAEAL